MKPNLFIYCSDGTAHFSGLTKYGIPAMDFKSDETDELDIRANCKQQLIDALIKLHHDTHPGSTVSDKALQVARQWENM